MPASASAGGASKTYTFDARAYAKAVMHCCKHSTEACLGVLVGCVSGKSLRIVDTMPLFHTHSLAPMLKVAFMMIDQHCRSIGGLEIVGIYHASAHGSTDMAPVKAIAEKVAANFAGATVWAFDGAKLSQRQFALCGHYHSKDEWKGISADTVGLGDEALQQTSKLITQLKYLEIVDFDDHLTAPAQNWLNPTLFQGEDIAESEPLPSRSAASQGD